MRRFWNNLARACRSCPNTFWPNPSRTELLLPPTACNSDPSQIVGSGPFRLKEYKAGAIHLAGTQSVFFRGGQQRPASAVFRQHHFHRRAGLNAMSLRFLSGESDVDDFIYADEYDHFKAEAANGKFQAARTRRRPGNGFFWFNENTNVNPRTGKPLRGSRKIEMVPQHKIPAGCFLRH